jgi:hypothetical protein
MHIDQIILAIGCAMDVALLGCLLYRKLTGRFVIFFAYVLFSVLRLGTELWLSKDTLQFFVIHWGLEAADSALSLAVIVGIFWPGVELVHRRLGAPGFILPLVVLAVIDFSFWRILHHMFSRDWLGQSASVVYSFDLAVSLVEAVIFLLSFWLRRHYKKIWRRHSFAIISGFGSISLVTLIAYLTRSSFGAPFETWFRYLPSLAFMLITLLWIITFLRPEPQDGVSSGPSDPKQLDDALQKATNILDRTERILRGLFGYRIAGN